MNYYDKKINENINRQNFNYTVNQIKQNGDRIEKKFVCNICSKQAFIGYKYNNNKRCLNCLARQEQPM